ncbi:MAG: response regulator transcription factor [Cyclobacteriaceae bacterium]
MIKIIIADDHAMFREGIVSLISTEKNIAFVGEAKNGSELLELLQLDLPDVVLLDIEMPGMDGLETAKKIKKQFPAVKVLALTMHSQSAFVKNMIKAGATGYILKNSGKSELIKAIETVYKGDTYFADEAMDSVMQGLRNNEINDSPLSSREIQIIKLIANQMTSSEIAKELHLSPMTVETHRKNILLKLGLRNVAGLVKFAFQKGWIE